jgi:PAS domain S-box-containing protein
MRDLNLPDPELLAQAIEYLPDALVIVNRDGAIVLANRQTEIVFGHPRASLHGQPIETLLPEELRERHRQHFAGYAASPRVRPMGENLSLVARGASGQEFPVAINLAPLVTSGGTYFAAVIRRK